MNEYVEIATLVSAFVMLGFALLLAASTIPTLTKSQECIMTIHNSTDYINQETCRAQVAQNSTLLWGLLK